jgi:hypothetical protein
LKKILKRICPTIFGQIKPIKNLVLSKIQMWSRPQLNITSHVNPYPDVGVSMAGERLTPYIIFKGSDKATGRVHREFTSRNHSYYPPSMKYNVQGSAWMDEKGMLDWIERVWKPWAATKTGTTYLLLEC